MSLISDIAAKSRVVQLSSASNDFIGYAKSLLAAKGRPADAAEFAKVNHPSSRLQQILKSPVAPGSVDGATWGAELAPFREASKGFVASLAPFSAFDRIMTDGAFTRMPLRTRIAIGSTAATGATVSELAAKPISKMSIVSKTLPHWKAVGTLVITDELAKANSNAATELFANELRKTVAAATDSKFLEILTEDTGVASNNSTGLGAVTFLADLSTALQAVDVGVNSKLYLILPPAIAKRVALMTVADDGSLLFPQMGAAGGVIQGIRVVVSSAATDFGLLLDATAIGADSDIATVEIAREASIRMSDTPTSGEEELVSLWQNNLVALKAERYFGATVLRSTGLALITDFANPPV